MESVNKSPVKEFDFSTEYLSSFLVAGFSQSFEPPIIIRKWGNKTRKEHKRKDP
jgi:hypothetical protein